MSADRLVHPEWLALVLGTWSAAALAVAWARRRAGLRAVRLLGRGRTRAGWRGDAALLLSAVLVGAALLGPRGGERSALVPSRGVDLVLLVDVSRSMDASDVAPSRLARARRAGAAVLAGLGRDDRAALAVFAGRGVLLTPLTPDRDALAELLAGVDADLVRPRGSDLGAGVRSALLAFEPAGERPRAVLVLSDGEDPERRGDLGIADALRADARVHAAAFGLEAGAPVPDHGVALRDAKGALVVTRRQLPRLARLAEATGGELFAGDGWGDIDVAAALAAVRAEVGTGPGGLARRRVRAVWVAPFAALAFALLVGDAALRRPRAHRRAALGLGLPALLLLVAAAPPRLEPSPGAVARLEAELAARPRDPILLLRLGMARLESGDAEEAARAFTAAALCSRDPELTALAYYDLGVARLEAGELESARDAFLDALAIDATDREARFNLEWTLRAIASRPPPAPPTPQARPRSNARERPSPRPDPSEDPSPRVADAGPRDEKELRRWLDRVDDDLGRALRSAVRDPRGVRGAPGPGW